MGYEKLYWDQIKSRVSRINAQFSEDDSLSFLRLVTSLITGLSYVEIDEYITEGGDDLGSDTIYIDIDDEEKRFKLNIIQAKYNKDLCVKGVFNKNVEQGVIDKFKCIFDFFATDAPSKYVNCSVKSKKEEYESLIDEGYILDEVVFVSSNLGLSPAPNTKEIWDRWVAGHPLKDRIRYCHFGLKEIFSKIDELEVPHISTSVSLFGRYFEYSTPDVKGLIGNMVGKELVDKYEEFQDKLFQQNVRYYLGENAINNKIIASASDPRTRDKFWFLNNGITIVCEDYEIQGVATENIKVKLTNLQVVNGAQTTRAVYEAYKKPGCSIDEVKILVKVFKAKELLSEQITESTNNQNPVSKHDLRSNDEIQKLLEKSVSELGYFYQRKRKQFLDKPSEKTIDNLLFAQLYYSFYLEKPNEARNHRSKLFGEDVVYNQIFSHELSPYKIVFLHRLFCQELSILRLIKKKKDFPDGLIDRAKFFIMFALKLYFFKNGEDCESIEFLKEPENIDCITENIVVGIIKRILNIVNELGAVEKFNEVKVFQRKEIVDRLKDKFTV